MASVLQIKRGITANRKAYTPAAGELVLDTTTKELFIGDGTTAGGAAAFRWVDWYTQIASDSTSVSPGQSFSRADVYVDGVMQIPVFNYTIASNVITFTETVDSGAYIYCKLYQ